MCSLDIMVDPVTPEVRPPRRAVLAVIEALLVLSIVLFLVRGVWRAHENSIDFRMIYASTVVWSEGGDAYSSETILARFRERGGDPQHQDTPGWFYSLYPPSTYAVLSPLSLLRWPAAQWLWIIVNIAATCAIIFLGARCMAWRHRWQIMLWASLVLAFAPVHTVLSQGQVSLVCVALMFGGVLSLKHGASITAGILLGLSTAIKPQVGGLLVLILPITGHWKGFAAAGLTGLIVLGGGIFRLELAQVNWLEGMAANLSRFLPNGEFGAGRGNTSSWFILLCLETLILRFTDSVRLASAISYTVTSIVIGYLILRFRRANNGIMAGHLVQLSAALAAITLIPTYHRFYDAVLLLLPVMLVVDHLMRQRKWHAPFILTTVGLAVYYLPNSVVLANVVGRRLNLDSLQWYQVTFLSHQIWAMLLVVGGLSWWMARQWRMDDKHQTSDRHPAPSEISPALEAE